MVSWWGIDLYFNTEQIKIGDIEIIISEYGPSGSFGSRVRLKYIGHNTYTGRRSHFNSKPTPIYGPVNKSDLNFSYSRSHFGRLQKSFSKELINRFYPKVSYDSIMIYPVITGLVTMK